MNVWFQITVVVSVNIYGDPSAQISPKNGHCWVTTLASENKVPIETFNTKVKSKRNERP